jgi:hypothetical protein
LTDRQREREREGLTSGAWKNKVNMVAYMKQDVEIGWGGWRRQEPLTTFDRQKGEKKKRKSSSVVLTLQAKKGNLRRKNDLFFPERRRKL